MTESKELGTKWMRFIYGLFVFQVIMGILGIFGAIGRLSYYESLYGPLYDFKKTTYLCIVIVLIKIIFKIATLVSKDKPSGCNLVIISLIIDAVSTFLRGLLMYNFVVGLLSSLIVLAFVIPSIIYFNKRRFMYEDVVSQIMKKCNAASEDKNTLQNNSTVTKNN